MKFTALLIALFSISAFSAEKPMKAEVRCTYDIVNNEDGVLIKDKWDMKYLIDLKTKKISFGSDACSHNSDDACVLDAVNSKYRLTFDIANKLPAGANFEKPKTGAYAYNDMRIMVDGNNGDDMDIFVILVIQDGDKHFTAESLMTIADEGINGQTGKAKECSVKIIK